MQKQGEYVDRHPGAFYVAVREESEAGRVRARTDKRRLLLCLAVVLAAILISWPLGDIGFGDDVAFSHVALRLAQTGHVLYNGWEAVMILEHVYWGALVIKLFGFSAAYLRLSTVPLALGAVGLCYLLSRKAGIRETQAVLVTLVLGLSPIFLPFAVSYMTDVPGLFFHFGALYAFLRANEVSKRWNASLWLGLGTGAGIVGGTSRQSVWFVPLTVLLYLAWVRRRDVQFASTCLMAWALTLACVAWSVFWFNHQLYVAPLPSLLTELRLAASRPKRECDLFFRWLIMLLCMCLPAAVPLTLRAGIETWNGPRSRKILVGALLLAVFGAVWIHPTLASLPWMPSTLNWEGINGSAPLPGRPIVLMRPIRAVVAMSVYVAACLLAGEITRTRELTKRCWRAFVHPSQGEFAIAAFLLVSVISFGFTLVRGAEYDVFDRYLLPLMPCVSIVLFLMFEACHRQAAVLRRRAMPLAWGVLCIWASYAVLSTQDYWSLARARVTATRKLEGAGIPRATIDGGMEYNFWTQLQINGLLNYHWMKNPPGAYRPGLGITPEVVPVYRLEYEAKPGESVPTEYGSVPYFSFLPPFHKQVAIDKLLEH